MNGLQLVHMFYVEFVTIAKGSKVYKRWLKGPAWPNPRVQRTFKWSIEKGKNSACVWFGLDLWLFVQKPILVEVLKIAVLFESLSHPKWYQP